MSIRLDTSSVLRAYRSGYFPMADPHGRIEWLCPDPRGIIELDGLYISRSLRKTIQRGVFDVRFNSAFRDVLDACADRPDGTWISAAIKHAYCELQRLGWAHSVETWHDGKLAGGLYGVAIGGAFFGESMFHVVTDASKVALAALVQRMKERGMTLLDTQFLTPHLQSLGGIEIRREQYLRRLAAAIELPCRFADAPVAPVGPGGPAGPGGPSGPSGPGGPGG